MRRLMVLGSMRAAAQMVSYEIAMGFSLICVLMVSNSLNLVEIVNVQNQGRFADWGLNFLSWNWLPLLPMFVVYLISGVAETNRAPFDVSEGESEIVAGFHVEYSGMAYAVFFLAEYANMILVAALTALMFLGGWLSPVGFLPDGIFWLFAKMPTIPTVRPPRGADPALPTCFSSAAPGFPSTILSPLNAIAPALPPQSANTKNHHVPGMG